MTDSGVGAHDGNLVGIKPARFEQNAVGDGDGAHVVQGHAQEQGIDVGRRQKLGKLLLFGQCLGQRQHIVLHPQNMAFGVGFALLGQGGQRQYQHLLGVRDFALIGQVGGGCGAIRSHNQSPCGATTGAWYNHTILPPATRYCALALSIVASNSKLTGRALEQLGHQGYKRFRPLALVDIA